ncbi:MAG: nuclear transport factor 2 family protein [Thermomicrobiales bacterium]
MSFALPDAITRYYAGKNGRDYPAALSAFTPDAAVGDEAQQHVGHAAIGAWMADTAARYNDQSRVISAETTGDVTQIAAEVTGNFPGSPAVLRYRFTLRDGLIARLEIDG